MRKNKSKQGNKPANEKSGNKSTLTIFADWNIKEISQFRALQLSFDSTPTSKALISSMIKFSQMYTPLVANPFHVDFTNNLESKNEERAGRRARAYLYRKDLLKSVDKDGNRSLVLTTRAQKIFYQEYPLSKLRGKKWDGYWTVVMYDFPENKKTVRDYFRRKIKHLGFGSVQESVFVSPLKLTDAVQSLIEGEKVEPQVWALRCERVFGLTNHEVASVAWNLEQLNHLYRLLLDILPRIKKQRRDFLDEWKKYFLALNLEDPYQPKELLPTGWLGEKCQKEYLKLSPLGFIKDLLHLLK